MYTTTMTKYWNHYDYCLLYVINYFYTTHWLSTNLAVDGVAEVLLGHPNQAAADQDCHGDPVVQLEDHIVDGELVSLEDPFGGAQQVQRHPLRSHCHFNLTVTK